jgi:hypothetical protein
MPDIALLASRLINIFVDGFRDGPMWAGGLLIIVSWLIIITYNKYKTDLISIFRRKEGLIPVISMAGYRPSTSEHSTF